MKNSKETQEKLVDFLMLLKESEKLLNLFDLGYQEIDYFIHRIKDDYENPVEDVEDIKGFELACRILENLETIKGL